MPIEKSSLFWAAEHQDIAQIKKLLDAGEDPNVRDQFGQTPLHRPVDSEIDGEWQDQSSLEELDFEVSKLLYERGASINVRNNSGESPLDWVSQYDPEAVVVFRKQVLEDWMGQHNRKMQMPGFAGSRA